MTRRSIPACLAALLVAVAACTSAPRSADSAPESRAHLERALVQIAGPG